MARVVSVAVPVPALPLLSYAVPEALPLPQVGARVLVPLGSRLVTGCVVTQTADPAVTTLKSLVDVFDPEPMLPAAVVARAERGGGMSTGIGNVWEGISADVHGEIDFEGVKK